MSAAFAACSSPTLAAVLNVLSCSDDPAATGTLRKVVAAAGFGDVIDMSSPSLGCSTITLTQGEIPIKQQLTMLGPSDRTLVITANGNSRVLHSYSVPTLQINNLTITGGQVYSFSGNAYGGCIFGDNSSIVLTSSTVTGCSVGTGGGVGGAKAAGGGIWAHDITLMHSRVTANVAYAYQTGNAVGGGIWCFSVLDIHYGTISANAAVARGTGKSIGGGAFVNVAASIFNSTIDSNTAQYGGGLAQYDSLTDTEVQNSTVSGNSASVKFGGLALTCGARSIPDGNCVITLKVDNSTIAFNTAPFYPGVWTASPIAAQSTIIARNSDGTQDIADLYVSEAFSASHSTGANNLIVSSSVAFPGTMTADPQLAPLAYHGGATRTHALAATSPAIDHGNDAANLATDQRGFGRVVNSVADIGAYERQLVDDEIFFSGFN